MQLHRNVSLVLIILVLAAPLGMGGVVIAQEDAPDWSDELYERLVPMAETYNENVDSVDLGIAGEQLEDTYVNLYVRGPDKTATYSFYMDGDQRLREISDEPRSDASLKMVTDKTTVEHIVEADNPAAAFRTAVVNDDIVIRGEDGHIVEQVKWSVINVMKGIFM